MFDLGRKFDGKFSAVLVSFGFDAEAVMAKDLYGCPYKDYLIRTYNCSENTFMNLVKQAAVWHKQAFPNTPVFVQSGPIDLTLGVGYKTNNWTSIQGIWNYNNIPDFLGESGVWYKNPTLMRAFESKYGAGLTGGLQDVQQGVYAGTYWMLIDMLAHQPDFIDFHRDHWEAFRKMPWLNEFVTSHLGKTAETTPSVWTVLREIQDSMRKESWSCTMSGVYGDYSFFLYRRENLNANKTIPVRNVDLPEEAKKQPYTIPLTTDFYSNPTNTYTARRTSQASGDNYMSFDIDNSWQGAGEGKSYRIILVYLDKGSDSFSLEYKDKNGNLQRINVRKGNSLRWIRGEWEINNAVFNDLLEGMTDIRLNNNQDGDEVVHSLEIKLLGGTPVTTPTPTPTFLCKDDGDINLDGKVNETDLTIILKNWSPNGPVPSPKLGFCDSDLDDDGKVGEGDMEKLLLNWRHK